jgi:hypothetical protein
MEIQRVLGSFCRMIDAPQDVRRCPDFKAAMALVSR